MKRIIPAFFVSTILIFLLGACASAAVQPASIPTSIAGASLSIDYADAASARNQLAFGTLKLAGTPSAVSADQAKTLIPLWQALVSLSGSETTTTEELTAVQDQITAAMTAEQLKAIAALQITNANLNVFYAEYGIVLPTPVPGVTKVPGSGSGKTEEEKVAARATAAAAGQTTGTGLAAKTLLFDKVIEQLAEISK